MKEWYLISLLMSLAFLASILIIYPLRQHLIASFTAAAFIFMLAFTGYYYWGGFSLWQGYLQNQEKQRQAETLLQSIKTPKELIDKLRAKLDHVPQSAKGWYLLGRLYSSQNDQSNAVEAFAKAYQLRPKKEQYAVNYAHSLWQVHHRQFTKEVRQILNDLLKNNPNQPDALTMLAMDAYTKGAYKKAIGYWQRVLQVAPPQSEEAQAIHQAIVKAQSQIRNSIHDSK